MLRPLLCRSRSPRRQQRRQPPAAWTRYKRRLPRRLVHQPPHRQLRPRRRLRRRQRPQYRLLHRLRPQRQRHPLRPLSRRRQRPLRPRPLHPPPPRLRLRRPLLPRRRQTKQRPQRKPSRRKQRRSAATRVMGTSDIRTPGARRSITGTRVSGGRSTRHGIAIIGSTGATITGRSGAGRTRPAERHRPQQIPAWRVIPHVGVRPWRDDA